MALLLAMYQKMKLIREINQDTLKLTRITSKIDRVTKNIERTQKRFTSLFAQLDQQAKMMQSNATMVFQGMAGLGMNNFANSTNPYGFTGMNGFVYGVMRNMFQNNIPAKTVNGKSYDEVQLGDDLFQTMYADYMANGGKFMPITEETTDDNGNAVTKVVKDENGNPTYNGYTYAQVQAFNQAMQMGQMQQQQAQMWVQQANTQYQNNVSIWLDAAKAQLEAEQDAALEPLSYEDTMLQLEKEQLDARLQRLRAEKESYDTLVGEEAKNMAPTFGLR